jgi:hypothetical protein
MSSPRLICPHEGGVFRTFAGRAVAVRVSDPAVAAQAATDVQDSRNALACVIIESEAPFADIAFDDQYKGLPLAVVAPSLGRVRAFAQKLDLIRALDLRVYLPCDRPDNIGGLRILSSLGVACCALLRADVADWEALTDLASYALLGRVPHAAIEPFASIAARYDPAAQLDWGATQFDDPSAWLHLDAHGRVALSRAELAAGIFIAQSIDEVGAPEIFPAIRARMAAWRKFFVDNHPCASCRAWKICLGRTLDEDAGCAACFSETIEAVGHYRALTAPPQEVRIWQP